MVLAVAAIDWVIVAAYGAFVVALGLWNKARQKNANDYLLGGKRIPWWAIGVSLIATSFSSLSLLGWTDLAYAQKLRWFQLQIGDLLGIGLVCVLFLPFFAKQGLTTAYEFLEDRLGRGARVAASAIFHILVLARAGLLLFATAAAGAELLGVSDAVVVGSLTGTHLAVIAVGVAAMAYSAVGGLGAVVWTDTVQLALVVIGVGACFFLAVSDLPGGVDDVIAAYEAPSETPAFVDPSTDLDGFPTLLSSILAYGLLAVSVAGTNQQAVQRYLACRDIRAARSAAMLGWALGAVVVLLTMLLGIALNAWYEGAARPGDVPVLASFMADRVPVGLTGVLIAAILAASMSSMDSAIHSMATASLVDFVEPARGRPFSSEAARLRVARGLTLVHGVLAVGAALVAMGQGKNVIQLLVDWLTFLSGPILGLFLVAMFLPRLGQRAALVGMFVGYALALVVNDVLGLSSGAPPFATAGIHKIWTAFFTTAVTVAAAYLTAQVLGPRNGPRAGGPQDNRSQRPGG